MTNIPPNENNPRAQVEALRKKLLDLSLKNKMLNFRPSSRLSVSVIGESSADVYRLLVSESRKMTFVGKADTKPSSARPAQAALDAAERGAPSPPVTAGAPPDSPPSPAPADTKLSTDEPQASLAAKLRVIQREADLANDELGVNTLYLALGALEWRETPARSYRAPLLYIPISLERQANGSIRLLHDGSDPGDNLPLRAKLGELSLRLPPFDDDAPIETYFSDVESVIEGQHDWHVHRDEISLSFFNYEKYAMYHDLGGEAWPDDRKPWAHADVVALTGAGYSSPDDPITDSTFLDDVKPLAESHEVYDADSSQTIAMIRAAAGLSMLVEGPPGTGKSQTITNIIAEAVADNRTVLFVAAKRAAVDVVKRRLSEAGLSAMCLDLHDKLTNRRTFYSEIKATLNRTVSAPSAEERVVQLAAMRTRLTDHSRAANEPLSSADPELTPFQVMMNLASLPKETADDREGRISFDQLAHLTARQVEAAGPTVAALQERLRQIGVPVDHPYWGAQIDHVDPQLRLDLETDINLAVADCDTAQRSFAHAAALLRIDVSPTAESIRVLRACAERALSAPSLDGVAVKAGTWSDANDTISQIVSHLRSRAEIMDRLQPMVSPAIWTANIAAALRGYEAHAEHWYRFVMPDYRAAQREFATWLSGRDPSQPPEQRDLLRQVASVQASAAFIDSHDADMKRLYGVQWRGVDFDPSVIETLLRWVLQLHSDVHTGAVPAGLIDFFSGGGVSGDLMPAIEADDRDANQAISRYEAAARLLQFDGAVARTEPWTVLNERLRSWRDGLSGLHGFIAYNEARRKALDLQLEAVVETADRWPLASARLLTTFRRSYYIGLIRRAIAERAPLRTFERLSHERSISEFRSLDDFKLKYNRARVQLAHQGRLPDFALATGNLQALKVQCELQMRHKPIRWIMSRAGEAVQRTKPVFMMSPLSVAVHLPPDLPPFDMVIFDEASQIKPEDALCSIIRGRQIVVVGDTRQMPPTSFFDRVVSDDELEYEDDDTPGMGVEAQKLESVLSLMSAATMGRTRRPDLRWHYRSLHQSLIQPSNEMFYQNRLIVFPSASVSDGELGGVVFHHQPDSVYESGERKRYNRKEAETVARAIYDHVRERPEESLMAAAMNKQQADLIFDEVSRYEREDPAPFQAFREMHPFEPLQIKNLESVQGDERDVVFISVTYGRDEQGVIKQRFGPLMSDGGERRLNVLITRARKRCEVFSNITGDDLRVDRDSPGLKSLKQYLQYAQSGNLDVSIPTGRSEESPFEEQVGAALREHGFAVDVQVGCEGYRIDLAVIDPAAPGRYLVGVECDGAAYHSARSARDRDKLRQRVLEARGWRLYRIWSPDWWQDRDGEVARLIAFIEAARGENTPPQQATGADEIDVVVSAEPRDAMARTRPYEEASLLPAGTERLLAACIRHVVAVEGPICHDLLFARLRAAAGYDKAGKTIRAWIEHAVDAAVKTGEITRTGDTYWTAGTDLETPRDWSDRPAGEKKAANVPDVEIAAALRSVVEASFGVTADDAVKSAFRLIGFQRAAEDALDRGRSLVALMLRAGEFAQQDGMLRPGPTK